MLKISRSRQKHKTPKGSSFVVFKFGPHFLFFAFSSAGKALVDAEHSAMKGSKT